MVYYDNDRSCWSIDEEISSMVKRVTNKGILAVGELKKFVRENKYKQFAFIPLLENEEESYNFFKLKGDEVLCRYMTNTTAIGGMMPLCILDTTKGTLRFVKDLEAPTEDLEFLRGVQFEYLRTIKEKRIQK